MLTRLCRCGDFTRFLALSESDVLGDDVPHSFGNGAQIKSVWYCTPPGAGELVANTTVTLHSGNVRLFNLRLAHSFGLDRLRLLGSNRSVQEVVEIILGLHVELS